MNRLVTVAVAVMIAVMVAVMVVVMITMVITVPMAFVIVPAILVTIVVRVAPVCPSIRGTVPAARHPVIAAVPYTPVSVNPEIARTRCGWPTLVPHGWRSPANYYANLRVRRACGGECGHRKCSGEES